MLIGHYGAALALRPQSGTFPLWGLFLIVQAVDIVFFVFAPLDIEELVLIPGMRGPLAMDLVSIPISHSLLLNVVYATVIFVVMFGTGHRQLGLVVAAAFISHWVLDLFVHQHDLPLTPAEHDKVGFGLWDPPVIGLVIELGVLAAGAFVFLRMVTGAAERRIVFVAVAVMAAIQIGYVALPSLRPVWLLAIGAELLYAGLAAGAWWIERRLRIGEHST